MHASTSEHSILLFKNRFVFPFANFKIQDRNKRALHMLQAIIYGFRRILWIFCTSVLPDGRYFNLTYNFREESTNEDLQNQHGKVFIQI